MGDCFALVRLGWVGFGIAWFTYGNILPRAGLDREESEDILRRFFFFGFKGIRTGHIRDFIWALGPWYFREGINMIISPTRY